MPAPSHFDAGTASQLIASVRQTWKEGERRTCAVIETHQRERMEARAFGAIWILSAGLRSSWQWQLAQRRRPGTWPFNCVTSAECLARMRALVAAALPRSNDGGSRPSSVGGWRSTRGRDRRMLRSERSGGAGLASGCNVRGRQ